MVRRLLRPPPQIIHLLQEGIRRENEAAVKATTTVAAGTAATPATTNVPFPTNTNKTRDSSRKTHQRRISASQSSSASSCPTSISISSSSSSSSKISKISNGNSTASSIVSLSSFSERPISSWKKSTQSKWIEHLEVFHQRGLAIGKTISKRVPGVRYSAAFLFALRQNLLAAASLSPESAFPTPIMATVASSSSSSSSSAIVSHVDSVSSVKPADLPPLSTYLATDPDDRIAGLRLVADSVAQQRQLAATHVLTSLPVLALDAVLVALAANKLYASPDYWPVLMTTATGCIMTLLILIRLLVAPYISRAEAINYAWLGADDVLVARYGDDIIGAAIVHLVSEPDSKFESESDIEPKAPNDVEKVTKKPPSKKKKPQQQNHHVSEPHPSQTPIHQARLRAWTVRRRERGRGVGTGLLEEVVRLAASKQCSGVAFAEGEQSAYDAIVLPAWLRGNWRRDSVRRAKASLAKVWQVQGIRGD